MGYFIFVPSMSKENINIRKLKPSILSGRIDASSFNSETNEVNVVFATEALVLETLGDGERFYEQLEVSSTAADLARFNNNAAVLDNHRTDSITNQIGKVERAWVDNATKEAWATLKLSDAEAWKTTVNDISKGIITNISFTFRRKKMVDTGSQKDGIRILKTTEWEGLEISFVTIPADFKAGTRMDGLESDVTIIQILNNNKMTEEQKLARKAAIENICRSFNLGNEFTETLVSDEAVTEDIAKTKALEEFTSRQAKPNDKVAKDAAKAATERATTILSVCRKLNIDNDFAVELIGKEITLDAARAAIIDKAAEMQAAQYPVNGNQRANVTAENITKRALCRENAILERMGITKDEKGNVLETTTFRNMSLLELAIEHAIDNGSLNPSYVGRRSIGALYGDRELKNAIMGINSRATGLSSSDFPALMENVLNKVLRNQYQLAEKSWDVFTKKTTANDFKLMSRPSLHDVYIDPIKDVVAEGGEYSMVQMGDHTEKYAIRKWGKKVVFTWESTINDDLSSLDRTTAQIVAGFTQAQNRLVYSTLTSATALADGSNKMYDGNVIFTSGHNNLIGTGTTISLASLQAMRTLLRQQTAPNGNLLNLRGRFLVVGPLLETLAEQFTSANFTPNQSGVINKFGPTLTPVVDANITDYSWFIIADPGIIDTIEVASLGGQEMYAESRYSFDVDGIESKVRMTFGQKAIDWRGMVKNPGASS